ncbi:hypothetical protein CHU92_14790 [Flavobacterium cyanobacteriorum]|uniref:Uncharacterized protein n=1 Tax=Flavobacterium cyanobacteriorum TaxID=2022802 RepID=A0A255YSE6_9FLAO|nr:hypothetical protein [Flavobacterium cyanobacteriorum]OYQ32136.1 hypothetical protein CHU92_14790 [Flavobacterium cyanobacteriorum]
MSKIVGSFYLRKTEDGNLKGEFTNNTLFTLSGEYAVPKDTGADPFVGRYLSSWSEKGEPHSAELVIEPIASNESCSDRYKLVWIDNAAGITYEAEAFVAEGMLIGHYVSLP